jgi:hypothetical protein
MRGRVVLLGALALMLAVPVGASAHTFRTATFSLGLSKPALFNEITGADYTLTKNMHPMSFEFRSGEGPGLSQFNSDLAFWGDTAYQGTFPGFRILDITAPAAPREIINYTDCAHPSGQGDVVVWGDVLTRSWDSASNPPASSGQTNWTCDGEPVPRSTEGVHVFDVSDPTDPDMVKFVPTPCGSHTATGVPDLENDRLLVYSTPSSGSCDGIDIIEVPLDDPSQASYLRFEPSRDGIACHDTGVILGDAMLASCAGGTGFAVWSLGGENGGSLTDPQLLYTKDVPPVNIGHSAAFSWDGRTLVFGWEPSGGLSPRCTETGTPLNSSGSLVQTDEMKTFWFFDSLTGEEKGRWVLPRAQSLAENCTLHNYNMVPTPKRDILVHGSYQSGIGVLDFTDPANAKEIAYADPAPLDPAGAVDGGDWSSYWYDGLIYESDIKRGLMVWNLSDNAVAGARRLGHLNPQTQEFTLP